MLAIGSFATQIGRALEGIADFWRQREWCHRISLRYLDYSSSTMAEWFRMWLWTARYSLAIPYNYRHRWPLDAYAACPPD
jgi:hypothetical protein